MSRRTKWLLVGVPVALLALALGVVLFFTFFDYYRVPTVSMEPTLPKGSRFFGRKRPYGDVAQVRRGDAVVYRQPQERGGSPLYVFRVVGLPGDRVEAVADTVAVNGQPLPRQHVRTNGDVVVYRETNGDASYEVAYDPAGPGVRFGKDAVLTVPPGHLFLLGDNRNHAAD